MQKHVLFWFNWLIHIAHKKKIALSLVFLHIIACFNSSAFTLRNPATPSQVGIPQGDQKKANIYVLVISIMYYCITIFFSMRALLIGFLTGLIEVHELWMATFHNCTLVVWLLSISCLFRLIPVQVRNPPNEVIFRGHIDEPINQTDWVVMSHT